MRLQHRPGLDNPNRGMGQGTAGSGILRLHCHHTLVCPWSCNTVPPKGRWGFASASPGMFGGLYMGVGGVHRGCRPDPACKPEGTLGEGTAGHN